MKRILCMILSILTVMAILPAAAYADADPFDPTPDYPAILGQKSGFWYKEESGTWNYASRYSQYFENYTVELGFLATSVEYGNDIRFTSFMVDIVDANEQPLDIPTSVKLVIDGDSYEFPNLMQTPSSGTVSLSENGSLLAEALAYGSADSVSVEIRTAQNCYSFALNPVRLTATLKDFCRTYMEQRFWHFTVDKERLAAMDEQYPLYVNGVPANYQEMHKYSANPDRSAEIALLKLEGLEPGMTPDQVHAVMGEPLQSFENGGKVMDIYAVEYNRRPKVIDPLGEAASLFDGSNIIVTYEMRDRQYVVVSSSYGCAAEGDQNVIRNAIYPIWDVQDYATALLGSPEETHSATGVQYVWRVGDQRLRLNVDFIVMGEGIETFTVSTGWGTDAA